MNTNNVTDMFPPRIWEIQNLTEYCQTTYDVTPNPSWMQVWYVHNQTKNSIFFCFCNLTNNQKKEKKKYERYPYDVQKAGSYIIWSNGLLDPWHGGGYLTVCYFIFVLFCFNE